MNWLRENFESVSFIIATLAGILPVFFNFFDRLIQDSKSDRIFHYIDNLKKIGVQKERISKYVKEYERLIFNKVYKTKLSYRNQVKLCKFYKKHKKELDWSTVTSASAYLDFSNKKASVKIPFSAWFAFGYFALSFFLLILIAFAALFLLLFDDYGWQKQIFYFVIFIASMTAAMFLVANFMAPVNMALKVKKYLIKQ